MAQVVQFLPSKHKVLGSNSSTTKNIPSKLKIKQKGDTVYILDIAQYLQ